MIWQKLVLEKFHKLNLELRNTLHDGSVEVVVPRLPDPKTQEEIQSLIPYEVQFLEGVKLKTAKSIDFLFSQIGVSATQESIGRNTTFKVEGSVEDEQALWNVISEELIRDGFYDTWVFEYEGRKITFNRQLITALKTRKVSSSAGLDDVDLKIALNITQDVNDFLKMIEGGSFSH